MKSKRAVFYILMSLSTFGAAASCYDPRLPPEDNFNHCRQAAAEGDPLAQYLVGQMFRKGDGVGKNAAKAVNWYRKAAEQDNRLAQYNLGWMYDTGEGVDQDLNEAIFWYGRAARQGDQYAPFNIGALYFSGRDLPRDPENALFWFEVALANGNEKGRKWRDKIAENLKPEQLERVQKRFDAWTAGAAESEPE
jgi:TPR repeat protein